MRASKFVVSACFLRKNVSPCFQRGSDGGFGEPQSTSINLSQGPNLTLNLSQNNHKNNDLQVLVLTEASPYRLLPLRVYPLGDIPIRGVVGSLRAATTFKEVR